MLMLTALPHPESLCLFIVCIFRTMFLYLCLVFLFLVQEFDNEVEAAKQYIMKFMNNKIGKQKFILFNVNLKNIIINCAKNK